jgi:hypothetical protein
LTICVGLFLTNCSSTIKLEDAPIVEQENSFVVIEKVKTISKKDVISKIESTEIDFNENEQNGGILDFNENGWKITPKALFKYNLLIEQFGATFEPALNKNDGVSFMGQDIYLTQEYMIKFALMNQKKKGNIDD